MAMQRRKRCFGCNNLTYGWEKYMGKIWCYPCGNTRRVWPR